MITFRCVCEFEFECVTERKSANTLCLFVCASTRLFYEFTLALKLIWMLAYYVNWRSFIVFNISTIPSRISDKQMNAINYFMVLFRKKVRERRSETENSVRETEGLGMRERDRNRLGMRDSELYWKKNISLLNCAISPRQTKRQKFHVQHAT